jgi:hypothetical protein
VNPLPKSVSVRTAFRSVSSPTACLLRALDRIATLQLNVPAFQMPPASSLAKSTTTNESLVATTWVVRSATGRPEPADAAWATSGTTNPHLASRNWSAPGATMTGIASKRSSTLSVHVHRTCANAPGDTFMTLEQTHVRFQSCMDSNACLTQSVLPKT